MNKVFVFVYGTLKTGCHFHYRLLAHAAKSHGVASLQATGFVLVDGGAFPFAVKATDEQWEELINDGVDEFVTGELFECNESVMPDLDRLEGYPTMYNRLRVNVSVADPGNDDKIVEAWMYYRNQGLRDGEPVCADGYWWPRIQHVKYSTAVPAREAASR